MQTGGTFKIEGALLIGGVSATDSVYTLHGGTIDAQSLAVAIYHTGTLIQTGGTINVAGYAYIGWYGTGATWTVTGGTDTFGALNFGDWSSNVSTLSFSGGTITDLGPLTTGFGDLAVLNISGTAALNVDYASIGGSGTGIVNQSGGNVTIRDLHLATATLYVVDSAGAVSSIPIVVHVRYVAPTFALATPSDAVVVGQPTTLDLSATGPESNGVSTWKIDWGDGTISDYPSNPTATSAAETDWTQTHAYATAGTYTVHAWATDSATAPHDAGTIQLVVANAPVVPDLHLTAVALNETDVNLAWDGEAGNETGFDISESLNGQTFTPLLTTPPNATGWSISSLRPSTHYWFKVTPRYGASSGDSSNASDITTNAPEISGPWEDLDIVHNAQWGQADIDRTHQPLPEVSYFDAPIDTHHQYRVKYVAGADQFIAEAGFTAQADVVDDVDPYHHALDFVQHIEWSDSSVEAVASHIFGAGGLYSQPIFTTRPKLGVWFDDPVYTDNNEDSPGVDWQLQQQSISGTWPVVSIAATTAVATEPASPGGPATSLRFVVARTGSIASALTVDLQPPAGTATPGIDYAGMPASVTIPAGQSSTTFDLPVLADATPEPDETAVLCIKASANYRLGKSRSGLRGDRQRLRAGRFWGQKTGPNPTDRAKAGTKHHVLTDANGVPLATTVTAANRHDVTQLLPLVDAFPTIRGKAGAPVTKPKAVIGDRGYDSEPHRQELRQRHIDPVLAERGTDHGSGLGTLRWVVERTVSWLHQARRLRVRYDKRADVHEAFVKLRCDVICWLQLLPFC